MDKPTVIPVTPPPDEIEMEDPQTGEKRKVFSISSQLAFISMYPIFYEARPIRKTTDQQLLKSNIITSELRRIFGSYLSSQPHNEVVANMVFDCFRCAVDNELEDIITKNNSTPDFKYRKFIHTKVLRGKTLDDVQRIIKNASKRIEIKRIHRCS